MPTTVEVFAPEPWARTPNESELEYELFKFFRDALPMERPTLLPIICTKFGVQDWQIKDITRKFHWLIRCAKYDVWVDASRRQGAIRGRFEAGANMVKLSKDIIEKAKNGLQWLEDNDKHPSYREAVEMVRLAIELNRAGLTLQGVATGREEGESTETDTPNELIEAAVQVNMYIRKKVKEIPLEVIDVTPTSES